MTNEKLDLLEATQISSKMW